jgi:hypothetical protein
VMSGRNPLISRHPVGPGLPRGGGQGEEQSRGVLDSKQPTND